MDRYDPFESMERMFEQMRRSMAMDPWAGAGRGSPRMALPDASEDGDGIELAGGDRGRFGGAGLRVERSDEGYVAIADLPGFEQEDISVNFDDGVLRVSASHEASEEDDLSIRRHSRRVSEAAWIPGDVDADAASATYRNGVLEVTLPVAGSADDGHVIDVE